MKKVFKKLAKWDQKTIEWAKNRGMTEYQVGIARIVVACAVVAVVF